MECCRPAGRYANTISVDAVIYMASADSSVIGVIVGRQAGLSIALLASLAALNVNIASRP